MAALANPGGNPVPDPALLGMSILIVDDEPSNVALLKFALAAAGFSRLRSTTDARQVVELFRECQPDLILLDLMMPHLSGFDVMRQLSASLPAGAALPPIFALTADINAETKHRALTAGAADFLTKPLDQVEVLLRIRHLLAVQSAHRELTGRNDALEETARARAIDLQSTLGQLENTFDQLRAAQQQMIQQERLSALGAMAAGLAHDFNNALSLILGYSELLLEDLHRAPHPAQTDEFLQTIITAAQEAAGIFGRLRGFYRPADRAQPLKPVDVNHLIEQAISVTRPRWHAQALAEAVTISVQPDLAPGLPQVLAHAGELSEMLTNLIFNAVDAMPDGGTMHLRTRPEADGGGVVIELEDEGVGMPAEVRQRCLEPFFTTKGERGTGLGLAMVYGTIQRHEGAIEIQSTPGQGTRITLRLPVGRRRPALAVPAPGAGVVVPLRILVVDDQPAFRTLLQRYLAPDAHCIETAADGKEALAKFQACRFDLVIADKAMPGLSGNALALQIKALAPATRVLLLTGYHDPLSDCDAPLAGIDLVVSKPVTQAALRAAVARVTGPKHQPLSKSRPRPRSHAA